MRIIKSNEIVAWVLAACLLAFFFAAEFAMPSWIFKTDFVVRSRVFSVLGPPTRVVPSESGGVRVVGEPIYVDVRVPYPTHRAVVWLKWKMHPSLPYPMLGVVLHTEEDSLAPFALYEALSHDRSDSWNTSLYEIDLASAPRRDGAVRLFISVPADLGALSQEWPLEIQEFRIQTFRPSVREIITRKRQFPTI